MNLAVRLRSQWWIIAILVSILAVLLIRGDALSRLDNLAYDHLLQLGRETPERDIVLVEIDDESLARFGRWPWNRSLHAQLIDRLGNASPEAIAYDTLFTEPSERADDALLGSTIARVGNVFVPLFFGAPAYPGAPVAIVEPIPAVRDAARGIGFTDFLVDPDGVVRSVPLVLHAAPVRQHLMNLVRQSLEPWASQAGRGEMIPFTGSERWRRISAAAVLNGTATDATLRDKIVLVGVTAAGIGPRYPVPGRGTMSGLEIDAQLLRGLLDHRMIGRASLGVQIAFAIVPLWLLMLAMGPVARISSAASLLVLSGTILAITAIALFWLRIWLPPATPLLALCIAYPIWGWRQLAVSQAFMRGELQRLRADPAIFPRNGAVPRQPALPSTIALLEAAIAENRDMKHFVTDRLDQLPDATLVTSSTGHILFANQSARNLFGEEAVDMQKNVSAVPILARFIETNSGEALVFPAQAHKRAIGYDALTSDGRYYAVRLAPQRSVAGNFAGWIVQFMDVSEAKAAQRQRDDILELLTHDMRSPQASILAVLETAPAENIAPEEARRIRHYAERTLGLADGFVQLARAESLEYALEEVALGDMLTDAIDDLWPQLAAKSITIDTAETEERLIVEVERSLLTRALINVLGNAIKYGEPGSHIRCTLGQEVGNDGEARATCAIADQGPGLDEEQEHRIFARFHRGPLGLGRKADGVGLGLSFVHTVVVRHGGEIRCQSMLGQGTTFTFVLPLVGAG